MDLENHSLIKEISKRYRINSEVISKNYKELSNIEGQLKNEDISVKEYNSLTREREHMKSIIMHREATNDGLFEAREIAINYLLSTQNKE